MYRWYFKFISLHDAHAIVVCFGFFKNIDIIQAKLFLDGKHALNKSM
jgi:hypothetical protein